MQIILLLNSLLLPSAVGVLVIRLIFPKRIPIMMLWATGYGLGMGLLAQFMLVLGILRVPYSFYSIGLSFFVLFLVLLGYSIVRNTRQEVLCIEPSRWSFFDHVLVSYIVFQIVFVFWHTFFMPVYEWDVIATHSFNAKVLFHEGSLAFHQNFPHREYPLQIPFLETWVAFNLGRWDDQWIKAIFFPTFLSFIVIVYYFFKFRMNRRWGLLAVVFALSSNMLMHHAASAYREFTLAYYNTAVFVFLFFWYKDRSRGWLILAGLFSGFCSFIKLEGLGYIFIHAMCLFILLRQTEDRSFLKNAKGLGWFLFFSLGMALIYLIYKKFAFVPMNTVASCGVSGESFTFHSINIRFSWESLLRIVVVLKYFFIDLFLLWNWNLIWFFVVLSLGKIGGCKYKVEVCALLWSLIGFFGVYLSGFALTQHYFWATNYHAVSRAFLHFFPLSVMLLMFLNYPSFLSFSSD